MKKLLFIILACLLVFAPSRLDARKVKFKNGDVYDGEWKNKASFFEVVLWGRLADNLKPYLVKGKSVAIVGTLDQDTWEKDGQKQSKIYITANELKLLGGKADNSKSANTQQANDLGFPEDIPTSKGEPIF